MHGTCRLLQKEEEEEEEEEMTIRGEPRRSDPSRPQLTFDQDGW